jgi:hypothetical protein
VSPVHNNNNVKKCLLEVPGVTGAFLIYLRHQRTDPGKKNNDGSGCRSAAHGTAGPDGTGRDGRRKIMPTVRRKTQQHNTDRFALETTAVRMCRLAWSWSKLNNTTTTKTRWDLAWEGLHCNVHVINCVAACVDVGGHQFVVVEYLTSSPVNYTRRHYKREYFIYKLFM